MDPLTLTALATLVGAVGAQVAGETIWQPQWTFEEATWQKPDNWKLLSLPVGVLVVRRHSLGAPYRGVRNQTHVEMNGPRWLADAFVKGANDGLYNASMSQSRGSNETHWVTLFKAGGERFDLNALFDSPEEARQSAQDVYLLSIQHMPHIQARAVLEALPSEALVRMDQLLSGGQ